MQLLALFDLDDTLIDRRAAFNAWAEEFVATHGLDDAALTFLVIADAHHCGPMDGFFATVCQTFDLAEPPSQLWVQYRRRIPELVSCRVEDLDALRRLRQAGWRIGIATNGMADNQLGKIRNTGLDRLVDAWCISDEVGIRKPDPEISASPQRAAEAALTVAVGWSATTWCWISRVVRRQGCARFGCNPSVGPRHGRSSGRRQISQSTRLPRPSMYSSH